MSTFESLRDSNNSLPQCFSIPGMPKQFRYTGYYPSQYCIRWNPVATTKKKRKEEGVTITRKE